MFIVNVILSLSINELLPAPCIDYQSNRGLNTVITLNTVQSNNRYEVVTVDESIGLSDRLQSLGFVPGAEVEIVAKVAFGGPLAVDLRGARFALRRRDAQSVWVRAVSV